MSCAKVIPLLLQQYPNASFAASRSVDTYNKMIEDYRRTQRYALYCYMIPLKFGTVTFNHYAYDEISSYILHNKNSAKTKKEVELKQQYFSSLKYQNYSSDLEIF